MSFFIIQNLLPWGLAALFGGMLWQWLFRRRYEDVTTEYDRLASQIDRVDFRKLGFATKDDMNSYLTRIQDDVKAIRPADLSPVQERLIRLEQHLANMRIPEPNLNPLHERFTRIESRLSSPDPNLVRIQERIGMIEQGMNAMTNEISSLHNTDLSPLQTRLDRLENAIHAIDVPAVDFAPLHTDLARIEVLLENLEIDVPGIDIDFDPLHRSIGDTETRLADFIGTRDSARKSESEALMMRLQTIQSGLSTLRIPDMAPLQERLARIESSVASPRSLDFTPLEDRLARVEYMVKNLEFPVADMAPFEDRMARVEYVMGNFHVPEANLGPVEDRLARLEYLFSNFRMPDVNLAPVEDRLGRLEYLINNIRIPDMNFAPVEDRLARLEYVVGNIQVPEVNFSPMEDRLRSIESYLRTPNDDIRGVHNRMSDLESGTASLLAKLVSIENAVSGLDRAPLDLGPLNHRVAGIDSSLNTLRSELRTIPDLAPIERRLAAVQETVTSLRDTDLTPVMGSLRKTEGTLDFRALENRLTSIEYGLAAMHDMLRSRGHEPMPPRAPADVRDRAFRADLPPVPPEPRRFENSGYETRGARAVRPGYRPAPVAAPAPPPRTADPLLAARRVDDQANLLLHPAFGPADDLEQITGIGPLLKELLNDTGVYYFWQIGEWSAQEADWVDSKLEHFRGRISRDGWVDQAHRLMRQPGAARRPA